MSLRLVAGLLTMTLSAGAFCFGPPMSALGRNRTFSTAIVMSALPPKATSTASLWDVR